jgi:signal transduction histidine kinase
VATSRAESATKPPRRRMSLRSRLLLAAAYMLTVVVVALELPLAITLKNNQEQTVTSSTVSYTAITASAINDDLAAVESPNPDLPNPPSPLKAIADVADRAAQRSRTRMVVVDSRGILIYDTRHIVPLGTNYTNTHPEFGQILGQRQGTLPTREKAPAEPGGPTMLLVTAPVLHDRQVIGAVRAEVPISTLNATVGRSWLALAAIGLAVIVVGLILAWFLARSIARPVERLEDAADDLRRGELDARAPVEGPEEVASLSTSFNRMADAMEANLTAQRDFVANASHQLRTPMTGLRLRLEAIEGEGGFPAEQATKAQVELSRLAKLVDDLLALARASSVGTAGSRIDLCEAVREAADRWCDTARSNGKSLEVAAGEPLPVITDPSDLGHVLDNLIENAIKYSPPGGTVRVEATSDRVTPVVAVADDGVGIPPAERERIFERFFRGTIGLSSSPGTGLGLAIVAELVHKWGGNVCLADQAAGTRFEVRFPAVSLEPAPARTVEQRSEPAVLGSPPTVP